MEMLTTLYINNFKNQDEVIQTETLLNEYSIEGYDSKTLLNEWTILLQNTALKRHISTY